MHITYNGDGAIAYFRYMIILSTTIAYIGHMTRLTIPQTGKGKSGVCINLV